METSKTYNRTINLLDKYTKFIKSINTEDIGNNLTLDKLTLIPQHYYKYNFLRC